jgi:hypothetical protein
MSKMSVILKGTVIATVVALALAAFSMTSVFAASSTTTATSTQAVNQNLDKNWKAELSALQFDGTVLSRVDRLLEKFGSTRRTADVVERGKVEPLAFKDFSFVLSKAEAVGSAHTGFDASGSVTDQAQALKSVQELGSLLDQLRGVLIYRLRNLVI